MPRIGRAVARTAVIAGTATAVSGHVSQKQADKQAILYELVAEETAETYTSERRREHSAYR